VHALAEEPNRSVLAAAADMAARSDDTSVTVNDAKSFNVFLAFRKGLGQKSSSLKTACFNFLLVLSYVGIGIAVFHNVEDKDCEDDKNTYHNYGNADGTCRWSVVDTIYFCTVTMSTVGYGDFSPSTPGTKVFTIIWILVGIIFVFSAIATTVGQLIHPIGNKGRELLERLFPQIEVDLNGNGEVDYKKPRHWTIYYSKNLLPLLLIVVVAQLACAGVFLAFEDWDYGDAVYHCLVTATTVGYGDMSITTDGGKLWAVFHIIISVSLLGDLIATLDELRDERRAVLAKVAQLTRKLDSKLLKDLMETAIKLRPKVVRDGKGLTEFEFVLGMLLQLKVIEWGQVRPFIDKFRTFDMDGTGRVGQNDLDMMVRGDEQKAPTMDIASRQLDTKALHETSSTTGSAKLSVSETI